MAFGNLFAHPQAQAGANVFFSGKKRLKYVSAVFLRNAGAIIGNFYFHAVAVLSGAALLQQGVLLWPLAFAALVAWVLGAALFSGDIALRAFAGHWFFPMAAPTGGIILIAAWLLFAAAAIGALLRS